MSETIAVSTPPPRTYPAPSGVVDEVLQGVRWARAYGIDVPEPYQSAAHLLASAPSLEAPQIEDLALLFDSAVHEDQTGTGWAPGSGGYPCPSRVLASLSGGEPLKQWSEHVLASLERTSAADYDALLASISHDPQQYRYRGLCTSGDPDVVTHLARAADESWQCWDPSESVWHDLQADLVASCPQVDPDEAMLAAIIDAVSAGDGLALMYAIPVSFLPSGLQPTTLGDDVEQSIVAAVVDYVDVSAVWSLVRLDPGRKIAVRASGVWEDVDHWPTGVDIVPLTEDVVRAQVLSDIDSVDGVTSDTLAPADREFSPSQAAGVAEAMDRMFAGVIAAIALYDDDDEDDDDECDKARALISDVETLRDWAALRVRRDALSNAVGNGHAPVIAVALGGPDRNRGGARRLRRYWTHGKGALKIAWGVHGDWRRCYRQLFKYMGPRAAGYCQLRHKEQTGLYTGDKLHRAGISTIKASAAPLSALTAAHDGSGAMIALVPRPEDAERLVVQGGEPVEELHVTLCFLGKLADWSVVQTEAVAKAVASMVDDAIVPNLDGPTGVVAQAFGVSLWNPDTEAVWVYSIGGSVEIPWVYDIVKQTLRQVGEHTDLPLPEQHVPYVPHITAGYGRDFVDDPTVQMSSRLGPVVFDRLRVSFGNDVVDYRLDYLKGAS